MGCPHRCWVQYVDVKSPSGGWGQLLDKGGALLQAQDALRVVDLVGVV